MIGTIGSVLAVALAGMVATMLTGLLLAAGGGAPEAVDPEAALRALGLASLANAVVLVSLVRSTRLGGLGLAGWIFVVHFLVAPVLSLVESLFFRVGPDAPTSLRLIGIQGSAILLVALAIPSLTGRRRAASGSEPLPLPPLRALVGLLAGGALVYLVVYWTFGYWVAWQRPEVRAYYGGGEFLPFFEHVRNVAASRPDLFLFQLLRGAIWMGLALFVVRRLTCGPVVAGLRVGLAFAVLMGSSLLLPNPYMPASVRMVHLAEVLSSNLLYGFLAGFVWRAHPGASSAARAAASRSTMSRGRIRSAD